MGSGTSTHESEYSQIIAQGQQAQIQKPLEFKEGKFKLHVAIDFGTNGCGIGFAYNERIIIYNKWRGQTANSNLRGITRKKTKTQLILNDKNKVTCFGNAAKFMYYNFEKEERKTKKFFERFKMALFEDNIGCIQHIVAADEEKKRDDIDTRKYIYAADGQKVEAEIVFIAAFQQLQAKAKEFIPKNITSEIINDDEIQWIVTVPAIWSQKAKNDMKKWIIAAGLVKENIMNQCVIVYEPDCGSLSIQKQFFKDEYPKQQKYCESKPKKYCATKPNNNCNPTLTDDPMNDIDDEKINPSEINAFEDEDTYILIDAGGGTVDIACHKICSDGSVEEIVYPTGGRWGSTYIDDLFITLLENMFGKEFMNNFQTQNPAYFVELIQQFEVAKKTFYNDANASTHRIQLPNDFMLSLYEKYEQINQELEQIVNEFAESNTLKDYKNLFEDDKKQNDDTQDNKSENKEDESECVLRLIKKKNEDEYDTDDSDEEDNDYRYIKYLEMDVKIWKCLFDSKINPIQSHVIKLLQMKALRGQCKYLGLVGGFSCSKYFQQRMRDAFGVFSDYTMNIIVPNKPMLSVVEGAALMAITKDYIRARKLPFTYGVCLRVTKTVAKAFGVSDEYMKNNTGNDGMIDGCFFILGRRNERIGVNEVRVKESYRYRENKTHSRVPIYRSLKSNPITRDDGEQIAILEPQHFDAQRKNITEFHFYDTMLKVYSYAKTSPQQKKSLIIKFN